jgi:DNA-binding XRE family transcriptional regulator
MTPKKKAKLEAAGFRVGDAEDFLELTPAEREIVELRVALARAVRQLREKAGLTQGQLAERIGSSQPRVAKMESGSGGVTLDLLFRGYFTLGGTVSRIATQKPKPRRKAAVAR